MTHFYKTSLSILTCLLFILFAGKSFAQYPGMGAFRAQQSQQFANQQLQMQMQNANWRTSAGQGEKYKVTFKDSSVKELVSFMYKDTVKHKTFLVLVDKNFKKSDSLHRYQKIYPDQTLYISTIIDYQANTEIYGVQTDSCWTFKIMSGAINVYSDHSKLADWVWDYIVTGIQLNDGPILRYSPENLKQMVGQDADAVAEIEKKNYYRAVKKYNRNAEKAAKK